MYQRKYCRPHENGDPMKAQLYWDGYQWVARPHSHEEIIKLNEKKVQLVNIPLNYNINKKQIKKYILEKMVEKDIISSKLNEEQKDKKILDIEINKDTNVVLLTMENLELAKLMVLLDGIILLGHTIRVSMYKEIKDLSLTNIQKANALANSANVAAKSAAISIAAYQSIVYNKNTNINTGTNNTSNNNNKSGITLNIFNSGNDIVRNKDTSNVVKVMGILGNDEEKKIDYSNINWKELYDDMEEAFDKFGTIKDLFLVTKEKEKLGAEAGSVFIRYETQGEAENAYRNMFNKKYCGNDIKIVFFPEYVFISEILPKRDDEKGKENESNKEKENINK